MSIGPDVHRHPRQRISLLVVLLPFQDDPPMAKQYKNTENAKNGMEIEGSSVHVPLKNRYTRMHIITPAVAQNLVDRPVGWI